MRLVLISDTHGLHDRMAPLPEGDVLVHAGDLTNTGKLTQLREATDWLRSQLERFEHIVCVGGNHDFVLEHFMNEGEEEMLRRNFFDGIHYLRDSEVIINSCKFYGSPWTPEFNNWAFNLPRSGGKLKETWNQIPANTDVLITHGPPMGILDHVGQESVGCNHLRVALSYVQPAVHVFGHIHNAYGSGGLVHDVTGRKTKVYNASICATRMRWDEKRRVTFMYNEVANKPFVIEI